MSGVLTFIFGTAVGAGLIVLNHKSVQRAQETERRRYEYTIERQRSQIEALRGTNKYYRDLSEFRTAYEMGVADERKGRADANREQAMFYEDRRVKLGKRNG